VNHRLKRTACAEMSISVEMPNEEIGIFEIVFRYTGVFRGTLFDEVEDALKKDVLGSEEFLEAPAEARTRMISECITALALQSTSMSLVETSVGYMFPEIGVSFEHHIEVETEEYHA
jgi:hypothetical protein